MRPLALHLASAGALVASMAAGTPVRALAQPQQPATVPSNLVSALFSSAGRIWVGELPSGFPSELVPPPPATVVGGVSSGRNRTVIFAYPGSPTAAAATYRAQLEAAGFQVPGRGAAEASGFVSGPVFELPWLCRDSARATVAPTTGAPTGGYVKVELTFDAHMGGCYMGAAPPAVRRGVEPEPRFPTLRAPDGIRSEGGGASRGGRHSEISTSLITDQAPSVLLSHYGTQLETAGWTVGAPVVADDAGLRPVTMTDGEGREWRGALTVLRMAGFAQVSIRVTRGGPL